ncbi:hypothetical protein FWG86_02735 [Candidatus Saccharibacteria bacterium]|nr:hypothetical protein [Candidatus Saccharibacteria bacterium]
MAKFAKFPAHSLKVIAVYGETAQGATDVVNFVLEVLKADGRKVAMLADKSFEIAGTREYDETPYKPTAGLFQRFFAACKKAGMEFVVLEVNDEAVNKSALYNVPLQASLILAGGVGADELVQISKLAIIPDGEEFNNLANGRPANNTLTFGRSRAATARIDHTKFYKKGTEAQMLLGGRRIELATFLANENAPDNMAAVAALATALEIPNDLLESGIANYVPEG